MTEAQIVSHNLSRLYTEIDGLHSDIVYYSTAWGGDPDEDSMARVQAKIDELNEAVTELEAHWSQQ